MAALLLCLAGLSMGMSSAAQAALTVDKQAPPSVLFGTESTVTLKAQSAVGDDYVYNLSFRDVLPRGVEYVGGSSLVAPQIITNGVTGETTLIFSNVSDLSANATYALTYRVKHTTTGPNAYEVASTAYPELGTALEYRIEIANRGQVTANDVRLTDTMSNNVVVNGTRSTQGRCTTTKSTVGCELGAIAPGQKVTVVVTVTPTVPGDLANTVSVTAAGQNDEKVLDNRAVANVRVQAKRAPATITKKASRKSVQGGRTVTYTVTVTMGRRAASGLRVCDRLPNGLTFVRATGAQFRKGEACWTIPYLGAKQRKTLRIVARTDRSDRARTVTNTAVLSGRKVARRKASAAVRVAPALARPGGVTG